MNISSIHTQAFSSPLIPQKSSAQTEQQLSSGKGASEQAEIAKLQKRDQEVRMHEQAHIAAAGGLAKGGATFSFETGPNGKQYAVGGEISIDTSSVSGNPEATIQKAQQIRSAALAPANPSAQDRAVAASATALETQARQELQQKEQEQTQSGENASASRISSRVDLFV